MIQKHIDHLFTAELQFRFASAVRLATTLKVQPLDLLMEWTHGAHRVEYAEIALCQDQADFAAYFLHKTATFLMAVAIKDALQAFESKPWESSDPNVVTAYQIARQIRNAFAHSPFAPTWMIDKELRDRVFAIPDVIKLDTTGLHGSGFDWRHYGGPLALFRLCRFVRFEILKDTFTPRKEIPYPKHEIYQQGDLILQTVDELPVDAVADNSVRPPDGGIELGEGHVVRGNLEVYRRADEKDKFWIAKPPGTQ
jgi:hypothetical protein